jgi:MFS family permease
MKHFIALSIVLCLLGGLYLLQGVPMFWPDRFEPRQGVFLDSVSVRLLGLGLLVIAALGVMVVQRANSGARQPAPASWQWQFFIGLLVAITAISVAFVRGEPGANPDARRQIEYSTP